MFINS